MPNSNTEDIHKKRMQAKKAVVDARIVERHKQGGTVMVFYGTGKGKSTAAFGAVIRALGHGYRCCIVQFIKGRKQTGEAKFFANQPLVDIHVMGKGFTWETQDKQQDIMAARKAWQIASTALKDSNYRLILLDEISYMFSYQYLPLEEVISTLSKRPTQQTVILTGRRAHPKLVDIADTVSHVDNIKHAFQDGVAGQMGIEW